MTTNNKHLVDSGREFAASIDINTVIIDIVRKMAELTEALDAEMKRSEALVVENAGLKECAVNYVHAVALWNSWADAEDKISPVLETPATDAFLAEVRAQGVEMFVEHCQRRHSEMMKAEPNNPVINQAITATRRAGEFACYFAAQLRGNSNGGAL